jgi:hypothetical protein
MRLALLLISATTLSTSGCMYSQLPPDHTCDEEQIARGLSGNQIRPWRVEVQGGGVHFTGAEYTLTVKATSFDSHGVCTISPDTLTIVWPPPEVADGTLTPVGASAILRPQHPGTNYFRLIVEHAHLERWSRQVEPMPVISHEQNAIMHLADLLYGAYGYELDQRSKLPAEQPTLIDACRRLYDDDTAGAIRQLESFRTLAEGRHNNDTGWVSIISEADNVIEGIRKNDHRFAALPMAHGICR